MNRMQAFRSLAWSFLLATFSASSVASAQPVDDVGDAVPDEVVDPDAEDKTGGDDAEDVPPVNPDKPKEPPPEPVPLPQADTETNCTDRIDNDGDSVVDCGDADCYDKPECQPTGLREQTSELCSDWIDNDGDGALDCDDKDCNNTSACQGSFKSEQPGVTGGQSKHFNLPSMDEGISIDEMIGKFGDNDGERNDYLCADGVDNDGDGRVDCADFGCRFDPNVTVCNPLAGFRFSVVGQIEQSYRIEDTNTNANELSDWNTEFSVLQMRFLGPIGNLENSFFLLNMRAERNPRLTFALFQLPIGNKGHFFNINSGGGGLTTQLIISRAKQLLLEPAFLVYSAFEQGNGAAMEVGGPIDSGGRVNFRAFAAGGSGRFAGNVGGRFFSDENTNYTWTAGGQLLFNIFGYYGRFDTPYIYTPEALKLAVVAGAKYDQRAQERYPAWNGTAVFKWWHFYLMAETYWKRELEFESWQYSYLAQAGVLIYPKWFLAAADFGEYIAGDLDNPPANFNNEAGDEIRRQRDERQFRAALHWYAYEQTGLVSLRYRYRDVKDGRFGDNGFREQDVAAIATYRF